MATASVASRRRNTDLRIPLPVWANTTPVMPPNVARRRLSVSSCANSRLRATPSATRSAISRRRRSARASIKLATFAQAMSSTIADTPLIHVTMRASRPAAGPRSSCIGAASAWGRAAANWGAV